MELTNKYSTKRWTKTSIKLRVYWKGSETPAQSTDLQVAADHEVDALKKMLTWLTIWFWVKKICCRLTEWSVKIW